MDDITEKELPLSHKKGERRRANRIVPFPDNLLDLPTGTLDNYVGNFDKVEDLPSHDTLPEEITSFKVEAYVNWLAQLTKKDQEHRERSAFVHFDTTKSRLVFPVNPHIGSYVTTTPDISLGTRFFSLARVHSHPNSTCFSPQDLKRVISGEEFVLDIVATQDLNFLLLRTDKTELVETKKAIEIMDDTEEEIHKKALAMVQVFDGLVASGQLDRKLADYINAGIYSDDLEKYGESFDYHWLTLNATWHVAKEFKLGFYWGAKDGRYFRVTEEKLAEWRAEGMKIRDDFFSSLLKKPDLSLE